MRVYILSVLAILFPAVLFSHLPAQEASAPAEDAASLPPPSTQRAEFDRLFGELKQVLAELRILQAKYSRANDQEKAEIERKWKELVAQADTIEPKMIAAAEKAYVASPNADQAIVDLLVAALFDHILADNFPEAVRLGDLLLENKCQDRRLWNLVGITAFVTQDYDTAEKYLQLAEKSRSRVDVGRQPLDNLLEGFVANPSSHKQAWAKEQQIRQAQAEADDLPRVLLKTNKGDIELELFENEAPNTVANFISLVEKGFYNGLTFHRVLPGFMAQAGCPLGTGTGGPGYNIPCECYGDKYRRHFRGSLSMAKGQQPDTGGSQFFVTVVPTSYLDGLHTVFGRVTQGMDLLHKLQRRDPDKAGQPEPDKILEAKVLRKRDHDYVPKKVGQ
jgi:cyclophilin family peptidyl-prolyl cis-trans isomerase